MILMARNYAGLGDDFQANYTLDFVIDNADIQDYSAEAQDYKSELALQREREAQQTVGVDSLSMDEFLQEEGDELDD